MQRLGFWRRPRGLWQWKKTLLDRPLLPLSISSSSLFLSTRLLALILDFCHNPRPLLPVHPRPLLPGATSYTFSDYFQSQSTGFFLSNPIISGPSVEEDEGEKSLWLWFRQGLSHRPSTQQDCVGEAKLDFSSHGDCTLQVCTTTEGRKPLSRVGFTATRTDGKGGWWLDWGIYGHLITKRTIPRR